MSPLLRSSQLDVGVDRRRFTRATPSHPPKRPRLASSRPAPVPRDNRIRFKLQIRLEAVLEEYESRRYKTPYDAGTMPTDDESTDSPPFIPFGDDEPPHNPRQEGFPAWLKTRTKDQILEFLASRNEILRQASSEPDFILRHAKSLCDYGDKQPSVLVPPAPTSNFGTSKRPKGPKDRRNRNRPSRQDHYGQKQEERNARIASVHNGSHEFTQLHKHLASLDLSDMIAQKGNHQPEVEETMELLEECKDYIQVPSQISDDGFCITDSGGEVLVDVLPVGSISTKLGAHFEESFQSLCADIPPNHFKISKSDKRFINPARKGEHGGVLHLGIWNQATWQHERPCISQSLRGDKLEYKHDPIHLRLMQFLNDNRKLFRHLGGILKAHDPGLYEKYESVELPPGMDKTVFWPFCMMALNRNYLSLPHKDLNDYVRGFCLLHCWGNFVGGDLTIKELRIKIPICKGQVVLFRSSILTHWNQPIQEGGIRHSMVLFTPWRMLEWKAISSRQVTNRIKREVEAAMDRLGTL
ncbi:hypothetical protein BJ508DRAFT_315751 [Ascobolus immersus RN42]|uniref:2OGFeDO JBP1/TET oxygenase domain-containing protein n=1 Tax=Ascobolus immersus RN42 TaxID=1160509 RepID=A0A3N4H9E8_ASCIM|nr:hypothetical protein BJ508DRAFT_315751 [Ascobolus immersus RN42]